jgi:hypothetical protein
MCKKAVILLIVSIAWTGFGTAQTRISNNVLINSLLRVNQHLALSNDADSLLEQNQYNPFNKTTVIHYTLPGSFSKARICLLDEQGKTIKHIYVGGSGRLTLILRHWEIAPTVYSYSLQINGKTVATRPLVIGAETTASLKQ